MPIDALDPRRVKLTHAIFDDPCLGQFHTSIFPWRLWDPQEDDNEEKLKSLTNSLWVHVSEEETRVMILRDHDWNREKGWLH
jgi:hypothetical protein